MACFKLTDSQFPVNCDLSLSDHPESQDKKCPIERVKWSGGSPEALAFQCDLALPTQQWKAHFSALQDILITMRGKKANRNFCTLRFILHNIILHPKKRHNKGTILKQILAK